MDNNDKVYAILVDLVFGLSFFAVFFVKEPHDIAFAVLFSIGCGVMSYHSRQRLKSPTHSPLLEGELTFQREISELSEKIFSLADDLEKNRPEISLRYKKELKRLYTGITAVELATILHIRDEKEANTTSPIED